MAKIKYNVKGVDTSGDFTPVKPGMYRAKIEEINDWSGQYGPGLEVVLTVTADSKGKKKDVEGIGSRLWTYIYLDHDPSAFRLAEFVRALELKDTGTMDTAKLIGKELQVRVKPDTNEDGEYRPRVGKLLALAGAASEAEEPDEEEGEEEEGEDEVDLDDLDRAALKKFIKENELDVSVKKSMSDDDIRAAITEATAGDEDEEEPDEEEEPEEDEDEDEAEVDLDELDRTALKKFIKDNELEVSVKKSMSDDDIRAAIAEAANEDEDEEEGDGEEEGEEDEAPDYNSWTQKKLKAELKERGLTVKGEWTKRKAVNALKKDDADDSEPF